MKFVSRLLLKLMGWQLIVEIPPDLKKYIVAVAPHTSWKDFFLGLIIRSALDRRIHYLGKKELFDSPVGFLFRWTGGKPVDRQHSTGLVHQVAELFKTHESFAIAIAPEGTRKKVKNLKTGFYYIAREAQVPIIPCLFDFENKHVHFMPPFYPTEDAEKDLDYLWGLYQDIKGVVPKYSISGERQKS